jgi:hypothetical protein
MPSTLGRPDDDLRVQCLWQDGSSSPGRIQAAHLLAGRGTSWPNLGERWPSRLVAMAAENRLSSRQNAQVVCGRLPGSSRIYEVRALSKSHAGGEVRRWAPGAAARRITSPRDLPHQHVFLRSNSDADDNRLAIPQD